MNQIYTHFEEKKNPLRRRTIKKTLKKVCGKYSNTSIPNCSLKNSPPDQPLLQRPRAPNVLVHHALGVICPRNGNSSIFEHAVGLKLHLPLGTITSILNGLAGTTGCGETNCIVIPLYPSVGVQLSIRKYHAR